MNKDNDVTPFEVLIQTNDDDNILTIDTISTDDHGNLFTFLDNKILKGYNKNFWKKFERVE